MTGVSRGIGEAIARVYGENGKLRNHSFPFCLRYSLGDMPMCFWKQE